MSQHIHKFRRIDMGKDRPYYVMQCSLPGCTTYVPMKSMLSCPPLKGKVAICNKCGDRFILDRRSLRQSKPTCSACVRPHKEEAISAADKFFKNLEKDLGIAE